jgi:hypothetical protein
MSDSQRASLQRKAAAANNSSSHASTGRPAELLRLRTLPYVAPHATMSPVRSVPACRKVTAESSSFDG